MLEVISTCPRTHSELDDFKILGKKYNFKFIENFPGNQGFSADEMQNIIYGSDICIIGDDQVNEKVLSNSKNLKHIIKWGTGMDTIDIKFAETKGIRVYNTPNILGKYVAEYTLGLIIDSLRKISTNNTNMKKGVWDKSQGMSLYNKAVGFYGFGNIGKSLANLLKPFNCKLSYTDLIDFDLDEVKHVRLEELIETSEILIICAPLTNETKDSINKNILANSQYINLLVNVSRGGLVVEDDIFGLVANNKINLLCLDVYKNEPPTFNNSLLDNEKILFTSHNASNTIDANQEVNSKILNILEDILKG